MKSFPNRTDRPPVAWVALALVAALGCTPALGADKAGTSAQSRYQRDSALCMKIRSHDERATCLSDASTTLAQADPSRAGTSDPAELARNAVKRCEPLPEADRQDCIARMQGQGTTSGSVAGGGIYRELLKVEIGPRPAPQPAASAPSETPTK